MADTPELFVADRAASAVWQVTRCGEVANNLRRLSFDEMVERMVPVMVALSDRGGPKPSEWRTECEKLLRAAVKEG